MDGMNWKCFKCGEKLVKKPVVFEYMNRSFSYEVPVCPKCGKVYIAEELAEGRMAEANRFLGHPHVLSDTVRTGFRIGRTMDYPTVNMRFEEGVLIPPHGVYVSRVRLPDGTEI